MDNSTNRNILADVFMNENLKQNVKPSDSEQNSITKKPKPNDSIGDAKGAKEKEYEKRPSKKNIFLNNEDYEEESEERTPNIQNKKLFAEDNLKKKAENCEIQLFPQILKKKKADYIYDFVKIRVHLDNHFYILSRFFISRMLTLCKVIIFLFHQ